MAEMIKRFNEHLLDFLRDLGKSIGLQGSLVSFSFRVREVKRVRSKIAKADQI
jgi:hypothetical protein